MHIKEIYQYNKDEINESKGEKITCECGCVVRKGEISRHKKTRKHIKLMEAKEEKDKEN